MRISNQGFHLGETLGVQGLVVGADIRGSDGKSQHRRMQPPAWGELPRKIDRFLRIEEGRTEE